MEWGNQQLIGRLQELSEAKQSGVLAVHGPATRLEIHLVRGYPCYVASAVGGRPALQDASVELLTQALSWTKTALAFVAKDEGVLRVAPSRLALERLTREALSARAFAAHTHVRVKRVPGQRVERDALHRAPPVLPTARASGD